MTFRLRLCLCDARRQKVGLGKDEAGAQFSSSVSHGRQVASWGTEAPTVSDGESEWPFSGCASMLIVNFITEKKKGRQTKIQPFSSAVLCLTLLLSQRGMEGLGGSVDIQGRCCQERCGDCRHLRKIFSHLKMFFLAVISESKFRICHLKTLTALAMWVLFIQSANHGASWNLLRVYYIIKSLILLNVCTSIRLLQF